MLDGQQRTISLCQYVQGDFSIDHQGFANLTGGRTVADNCQMLCADCNRRKSDA